MENSKKIILVFIIVTILFSCKKIVDNSLIECRDCEPLKKDSLLFINKKSNTLYIRIKSVNLTPSLIAKIKANNYYSFYNYVYIYSLDKSIPLKDFIDVNTFRKIDKNSNYFEDKYFIYFTPYNPVGYYFNLIDKKENVKFSKNKDTLYSKYGIFYKGVKTNYKNK